ncbi:polysaccharide pyruvyl transferase family protein [Paracoccus sp. MBLB3053]|uniref:Polysaccharide pyruvyl transferase family protein n=1 Tax=Paracoccus aurantius TaxID=3073814 RepID=A0ABU2HQR4_9RHOB|nr:polysaccharide pyruvyl transferase family protein [Paracoccus sp. MBLB3053]MDS9467382.1 polysaccharide pyruvyl transferase family protein [Paracoccus sp. MBLB3053]
MKNTEELSHEVLATSGTLDFRSLRYQILTGYPHAGSFGRQDDLDQHLDMLRAEFSGQSALKFAHAALIVAIRRGINLPENFTRFRGIWDEHGDLLLEVLDTRWLVSACETLADHLPDRNEAQIAVLASLFANVVKLYETERVATGAGDPELARLSGRTPIFDGMTGFMIGKGDMVQNLLARIDATLTGDGLPSLIARELVHRALRNDTVFNRFAAYQARNRWSPSRQTVRPETQIRQSHSHPLAIDSAQGYILLNDTGRLGHGFHAGTTFACTALRRGLASRGLIEAGWANDELGFDALVSARAPSLVVLNGEGTLHHGAPRAAELLRCCEKAKARGIPVAIVNSVWQDNPPDFVKSVASANQVYVRETASLAQLPKQLGAMHVPDVSFAAFLEFYRAGQFDEPMHDLCVIDSVVQQASHALQDFAAHEKAPFFVMPGRPLGALRNRAIRDETAFPLLLQAPDLKSARGWVTGRFHGLVAAISAGRPACAIPSNSFKIEAMLRDADMVDECLLPREWIEANPVEKRSAVSRCLDAQATDLFEAKRMRYVSLASERIEEMLDRVATLADPAPSRSALPTLFGGLLSRMRPWKS